MSVEYTIVCDGCSKILTASMHSAGAARQVLIFELGGKAELPGGRDLCAACVRADQPDGQT